ncbi:MAG: magnesium transporter MgtE [Nitrospinaceae bacterium]|nr:MAG: magnesium transporter MgtE [Nitrospinaceae bacterium]
MSGNAAVIVEALNRRFLSDHPAEAALEIEAMSPEEAAHQLVHFPVKTLFPVIENLTPGFSANLFSHIPEDKLKKLLPEMNPTFLVTVLGQMDSDRRKKYISLVGTAVQRELLSLMDYPENSAGRLMDTQMGLFRESMTVAQGLKWLRQMKKSKSRDLFLIDSDNRLSGIVDLQDLIFADYHKVLKEFSRPITAVVNPLTPREEVVAMLEELKLTNLPVTDLNGRMVGAIQPAGLVKAIEEKATASMQTMVGASKDERALSKVSFAVSKRLPWLEVNLLTAFLAASVVGIFEETISRNTALAVLLPVVAGQSGNTGAQALAVTMRGLALHEITVRQWLPVVFKEVCVGFVNGIAVALTTALGVFFWSRSLGLSLVIGVSMVLSMVAAGFAGAIVPIGLARIGQDPATSSSIILTTVTDIAGFFSFLGIATLLSSML